MSEASSRSEREREGQSLKRIFIVLLQQRRSFLVPFTTNFVSNVGSMLRLIGYENWIGLDFLHYWSSDVCYNNRIQNILYERIRFDVMK